MKNQFGQNAQLKDESEVETYRARTSSLQRLIQIIMTQIIEIPPDQFY
jgi:hypothetical protein